MFSANQLQQITGALLSTFDLLSQPASLEQAAPPHKITPCFVGFKYAGEGDQEIINAYGIGSAILTFRASQVTPAKFDTLKLDGKSFTLDAVHPIHVNAQLLFYKGIAKGGNS